MWNLHNQCHQPEGSLQEWSKVPRLGGLSTCPGLPGRWESNWCKYSFWYFFFPRRLKTSWRICCFVSVSFDKIQYFFIFSLGCGRFFSSFALLLKLRSKHDTRVCDASRLRRHVSYWLCRLRGRWFTGRCGFVLFRVERDAKPSVEVEKCELAGVAKDHQHLCVKCVNAIDLYFWLGGLFFKKKN